ncbi:MAG: TRAP transporter small permease [Clostridium sp.]|nr:TRAP transporter small permease [Clostridium sp.]
MKKCIVTIDKVLNTILNFLIFVLMLVMTLVVLWQVISRFVLQSPSVWSEEVARYCMVWIAMLGSAMAMKRKMHMSLTLVTDRIKNDYLHLAVSVFDMLCCLAVSVLLIIYGYKFMLSGLTKQTASLKVSMFWAYAAVPVGAVFFAYNTLGAIYRIIVKKDFETGTSIN